MPKQSSNDKELLVMSEVYKKIKDLTDEEKMRVLDWLANKFSLTSASSSQKKNTPTGAPQRDESSDNLKSFDSLADVFAVANVKTDQEKVLLSASYLQLKNDAADLTGREINKELQQLGHGVGNITNTITGLMARKPKLMIQTHKSGKTKQAQKKYKVTTEGLAVAKKYLAQTTESDD